MASEPLDSLDEFFDFTQLEQDNHVYQNPVHFEASAPALPTLGPDNAMDWQPTMDPMMALMTSSTIPSEFSLTAPVDNIHNLYHAVLLPPLVQDMPMAPNLSAQDHSWASSNSCRGKRRLLR